MEKSRPRSNGHSLTPGKPTFHTFPYKTCRREKQKVGSAKRVTCLARSPSVPLFSMIESPSAPTPRLPSRVNSVKATKSEHARALLARAKLEVIIAKADSAGRVTLFSPYKRSLNG